MAEIELNRRKIKAEETRNNIYQASIKLMEQKEYSNIKIEDICKKAGVSIGSFYNYYKSKNDILVEICNRADAYFQDTVKPNLTGNSAVENMVDYFVYYAKCNEMSGIEIMKELFGPGNKLYITKGKDMQAVLTEVIIKGQESGQIIRNKTPEEITENLFIAVRGVCYDWCAHDGSYDLQKFMKKYMEPLIEIFAVK